MLSCRDGGGGGKLSRPVYLAPNLLGYQSKIILLSLLISNYLNVKMYQLQTYFKSNSAVFFVRLFCLLSAGEGGKLSRPVYLAPPTHLGIKVKIFC